MSTSPLRYQLPKKSIKSDCPDCGPRHRRTLSRYVDTRIDEVLPESYGRCDRESNCGYHLSPYQKNAAGLSYADEMYEHWKENQSYQNRTPVNRFGPYPQKQMPKPEPPVHSIPNEVFNQSIGNYERNQFARLLRDHFGLGVANKLLHRFHIGTSSYWPGACVFWYIDEQNRKRGGQIKLLGTDWHTEKYTDREGKQRSKTSWVHYALKSRLERKGNTVPDWLNEYSEKADRSPCLFGLPQLLTAPSDQKVAIVEAPKTAIICTPYFTEFTWLAVGGLSYLNAERLASVHNRKIALFPDLSKDGSAFAKWSQKADELKQQGFAVIVSDYLEQMATDEARLAGLDLADYLTDQWRGYPPDWDKFTTLPSGD
jgi:hypothetical protein